MPAGMGFWCLEPFDLDGVPPDTCAMKNWINHGLAWLFDVALAIFIAAVAFHLTPLTARPGDCKSSRSATPMQPVLPGPSMRSTRRSFGGAADATASLPTLPPAGVADMPPSVHGGGGSMTPPLEGSCERSQVSSVVAQLRLQAGGVIHRGTVFPAAVAQAQHRPADPDVHAGDAHERQPNAPVQAPTRPQAPTGLEATVTSASEIRNGRVWRLPGLSLPPDLLSQSSSIMQAAAERSLSSAASGGVDVAGVGGHLLNQRSSVLRRLQVPVQAKGAVLGSISIDRMGPAVNSLDDAALQSSLCVERFTSKEPQPGGAAPVPEL